MGGQPLRLGPFLGGLNTASDPTAIADAELAECMNFELDIDGSLISRAPFKEIIGHAGWTTRILCLAEAVFSGTHYLIGSNSNGVYYFTGGAWTSITTTFEASVAVQYADSVYLVPKPGSANPGGRWNPSGGFVAVAAIPQGQAAAIHKERLFIVPGFGSTTNTSRLKFSDSGDFNTWPAANFIDISQGDGTKLIDITVFQDNLLLFKDHSTYVLAYDVRPTDAVVRKISSTIGVAKQFCVANYENQVYIIDYTGWVYEIINYDFHRLNTKAPFVRDDTAPSSFSDENIFICLLEDRLICRYHRNIYVYGLRTRTWTEWESVQDILHYFGPIVTVRVSTGNEYYAGSCLSDNKITTQFFNITTGSTKEQYYLRDTFGDSTSSGLGITDTGHTWVVSGGSASEYSETGGEGDISLASVNVSRWATISSLSTANFKITGWFKTDVLATGGSHFVALVGRFADTNNNYLARLAFNIDQTITLTIRKRVASSETQIATFTTALTHVAGTYFGLTFEGTGTQLRARAWLASGAEPASWDLTTTDSDITAAGTIGARFILSSANTNVLPVGASIDNFSETSQLLTETITCSTKTKNFDMAISHQFKRLWWWGADVTTNNDIIGTATPIILSFVVTWDDLASKTWDNLNDWDQPLASPASVTTTVTTNTGTSRRFAKFQKSLRYRQINFKVTLTTDGTTTQGPARLFTMTALTESKQVVPKGIN